MTDKDQYLLAVLERALPYVQRAAEEDARKGTDQTIPGPGHWAQSERGGTSYGSFPVAGDPRLFEPDPECTDDQERQALAEAAKAWTDGKRPMPPTGHIFLFDRQGNGIGHATMQPYGIGVYHHKRIAGVALLDLQTVVNAIQALKGGDEWRSITDEAETELAKATAENDPRR